MIAQIGPFRRAPVYRLSCTKNRTDGPNPNQLYLLHSSPIYSAAHPHWTPLLACLLFIRAPSPLPVLFPWRKAGLSRNTPVDSTSIGRKPITSMGRLARGVASPSRATRSWKGGGELLLTTFSPWKVKWSPQLGTASSGSSPSFRRYDTACELNTITISLSWYSLCFRSMCWIRG